MLFVLVICGPFQPTKRLTAARKGRRNQKANKISLPGALRLDLLNRTAL